MLHSKILSLLLRAPENFPGPRGPCRTISPRPLGRQERPNPQRAGPKRTSWGAGPDTRTLRRTTPRDVGCPRPRRSALGQWSFGPLVAAGLRGPCLGSRHHARRAQRPRSATRRAKTGNTSADPGSRARAASHSPSNARQVSQAARLALTPHPRQSPSRGEPACNATTEQRRFGLDVMKCPRRCVRAKSGSAARTTSPRVRGFAGPAAQEPVMGWGPGPVRRSVAPGQNR